VINVASSPRYRATQSELEALATEIAGQAIGFSEKIKSHNFDKHPVVEGTLMGIKGQYLMFDTGVINIRKFTSYEVRVGT